MHTLSFPARLKAEELLRRTGNEDIRIEKMLPQKHILFDSPPGQRNWNTPTEIPCSLAKAGYRLRSWRVHGLNCQSVWRTSVHERHTLAYKMEIKLAPCASRCPVTSALRNWRHDISPGCATMQCRSATVHFRHSITQNGERTMAAAKVF